eukprot:1612942-Amphidinium_carterae.1
MSREGLPRRPTGTYLRAPSCSCNHLRRAMTSTSDTWIQEKVETCKWVAPEWLIGAAVRHAAKL